MDKQDPRMLGIGGAPTRATTLPEGAAERKTYPVASGVMDYFPDALVAISNISYRGNEQHNPGQPLHWSRGKSSDEADTMLRHFLQRGTLDVDGVRHTAKMAWRALALLQKEIEAGQVQLRETPAQKFVRELTGQTKGWCGVHGVPCDVDGVCAEQVSSKLNKFYVSGQIRGLNKTDFV